MIPTSKNLLIMSKNRACVNSSPFRTTYRRLPRRIRAGVFGGRFEFHMISRQFSLVKKNVPLIYIAKLRESNCKARKHLAFERGERSLA